VNFEAIKKVSLPLSYGKAMLAGESAKKGYLSVVDQALVSGGNFITGLLLGRYVAPEEFGAFVLAWTTMMIVMSIQNALFFTPMSVIGAQKDDVEGPQYFGSIFLVQVITGALLCLSIALVGFIFQAVNVIPNRYTSLLFVVFFSGIFLLSQEFYRRLLLIKLDLRGALFNDVITNLLRISGILYLLRTGSLDAGNSLLVVGMTSSIGCVAGHVRIKHLMKITLPRIGKDFRESWGFGKWVLAEMLPHTLSIQGYTYLTALLIGSAATAALGASQNILNATNVLIMAYANIATPVAAKRYAQGAKALSQFMLKTGLLSAIPILGFYAITILFSEDVLILVYNQNYAGYGPLLATCSIYFILSFFNRVLQIFFYAKRRPEIGFISKSASLIVMLLLSYPLIEHYGVYGAASGTVISQVIVLLGIGVYIVRAHRNEEIS
jgi:O-antigen/teichoic acid export membrane protein